MAKKTSKTLTTNDKMEIWELLKDVPPQAQKTFRRQGGFSGTDVSPQWRMLRLTEVFGPMGIGWGYDIQDRWESEGACFVQVRGWYKWNEEIYYIGSTIGGTAMSRTPDESYKMAVTDAFGKSFSQIGLAASIYLGEDFAGSKYANRNTLEKLKDLISLKEANEKLILDHYKVQRVTDLNETQAKNAVEILENR
jgi:hypothetical protein